jgi:hypothetical protein
MEAEARVRPRGTGEESNLQAGRCVFGGLPFFVGSGEAANQRINESTSRRVREGGLDGIEDPTFATLGEEVRAWKLLLDGRFDGVRGKVDGLVGERFALEEGKA